MKSWLFGVLLLSLGCGSEEPGGATGSGSGTSERAQTDLAAVSGADREAMQAVMDRNDGMKKLFREAYGFAIFPSVGKGGFIVGGGGGDGSVYERGERIGTATLTFLSVGAQVGGQSYVEVVFFENKAALDRFKKGKSEFGAQIAAVAVERGVAIDADYEDGVAVFTLPKKGLMAEVSVSGQEFKFTAK